MGLFQPFFAYQVTVYLKITLNIDSKKAVSTK